MSKKKVFVADDREEVLSMLKDLLVANGFEVMVSKDSRQMVKQIISFQPHLILLDLLMPDLDGFEICQILNSDPQTQCIPIIVMSGLSDMVDIKRAYKMGVVGYFTKPFDLKNMVLEIEKAIANREKIN